MVTLGFPRPIEGTFVSAASPREDTEAGGEETQVATMHSMPPGGGRRPETAPKLRKPTEPQGCQDGGRPPLSTSRTPRRLKGTTWARVTATHRAQSWGWRPSSLPRLKDLDELAESKCFKSKLKSGTDMSTCSPGKLSL